MGKAVPVALGGARGRRAVGAGQAVPRHALHAPLALVLLVAAASIVGVAASKGLPSGSFSGRQVVRGGVQHHSAIPAHGYPGAVTGALKTADASPTAYGEPQVIHSRNGVLRVWFKPHDGKAKINGKVWGGTRTFTGTFPGPTLHVNPGDTIDMKFTNLLSQVTNLHFHGFRVSPSGLSDNVLRTIAPAVTTKKIGSKKTVRIVVHIPADHEQGLYWYHPHLHGLVDAQVYPGLAGMIVIGDVLRNFPWLDHIKRRTMALQGVGFGDDGNLINVNKLSSLKEVTNLLNGHYQPTLKIRPGEVQLWEVANISNEHWYKLFLGGQRLHVIGEDGNPVGRTWSTGRLLMAPAKRFEFLVVGPKAGSYTLKSLAFDQGHDKFGEYTLAKVVSAGKPMKPLTIPKVISASQAKLIRDVRNDPIARRRVLTFSIESPFPKNFQAFKINGKLYNPRIVDERVHLGQTEEWLLRNTSPEDHPFHIHTNDFLVEEFNGHKVSINGFQDTVKIPRMQGKRVGTVLIRQRYRKFQGEAVFHCHILFHEDNAMMGNILFAPRVFNPSFGK